MRGSARWAGLTVVLCAVTCLLCAAGGALAGERYDPTAPPFSSLYNAFNDSYKQALYATQQGDEERAGSELGATRMTWQMLLTQYYRNPPESYRRDARWQGDLATITGYIEIAKMELGAKKVPEAHEALEQVRRIWMAVRQRNGVRWFSDELTRFEDVLEPVVLFVTGGVSDSTIRNLAGKVDGMASAWQQVAAFGYRPASAERQKLLQDMIAAETQAISNLRKAVAGRDYPSLRPLVMEVRKAFAAVYLTFG